MREFLIGLIVLVNFILQTTLLHYFKIGGVMPNTALILVIAIGVFTDSFQGAVIGLAVGLLQDILMGRAIGLNAVLYLVIGYGVGRINKNIFKDSALIPLILMSGGTVFYEFFHMILIILLRYQIDGWVFLQKTLPLQTLYNTIIGTAFYFYVSKLFRSAVMKKR